MAAKKAPQKPRNVDKAAAGKANRKQIVIDMDDQVDLQSLVDGWLKNVVAGKKKIKVTIIKAEFDPGH